MDRERLNGILDLHQKWLKREPGGERADLAGVDLSKMKLCETNFSQAVLIRADLTGADLRGARLDRADLCAADLSLANLSDANLQVANFRRASLRSANIRAANLKGANLTDADLTNLNLIDAELSEKSLNHIRDDYWAALSASPDVAGRLAQSLREGLEDGSGYVRSLVAYMRRPGRSSEYFLMNLRKGDKPKDSWMTKLALKWTEEWIENVSLMG